MISKYSSALQTGTFHINSVEKSILSLVYFQKFLINFEEALSDFIEKNETQYIIKVQVDLEQEMRNVALRVLVLNRNLIIRKDSEIASSEITGETIQ